MRLPTKQTNDTPRKRLPNEFKLIDVIFCLIGGRDRQKKWRPIQHQTHAIKQRKNKDKTTNWTGRQGRQESWGQWEATRCQQDTEDKADKMSRIRTRIPTKDRRCCCCLAPSHPQLHPISTLSVLITICPWLHPSWAPPSLRSPLSLSRQSSVYGIEEKGKAIRIVSHISFHSEKQNNNWSPCLFSLLLVAILTIWI